MKIIFILSSLNDNHFSKRVIEFMSHGYEVEVYGFKRKNEEIPTEIPYRPIILAEIPSANYWTRIFVYFKCIRKVSSFVGEGDICFYSSLDIALFARLFIKSPYIYEVCDLTELALKGWAGSFLHKQNEKSINSSIKTILTSQGFVNYFDKADKSKVFLIPNKLDSNCPRFQKEKKALPDVIRIGFVGAVRYETVYNFIKVCAEKYPHKIQIHIFGVFAEKDVFAMKTKAMVENNDNIVYHGRFNNPTDLPSIYSQIDLSLATYSPYYDNVKYAEPNKLYEAIYFRCPIIVSEGVYLGQKVNELNVGYTVDALDEMAICSFVDSLNNQNYQEKLDGCYKIKQNECLNNNEEFFKELDKIIM